MKALKAIFEKNIQWAGQKLEEDPHFFEKLAEKQNPKYLWIGCSDSRVPANEILSVGLGDLFVYRNVANLFPHTDFSSLSVLEYAIGVLNIEHVIVCGHYGCGGIKASMENTQHGLIDNWLRLIRDISLQEKGELDKISEPIERWNRLVELNVLYQVRNICHTTIVQNAWAKGKKVYIHGWVYNIKSGLLKDLNCCISSLKEVEEIYRTI
jgi:carbonic anhydrase